MPQSPNQDNLMVSGKKRLGDEQTEVNFEKSEVDGPTEFDQ